MAGLREEKTTFSSSYQEIQGNQVFDKSLIILLYYTLVY